MTEKSKKLIKNIIIVFWIMLTSIIITFAHISLHLDKVSIVSIPDVLALFLIPFGCTFILPFLAEFEDIKFAIYACLFVGIFSLILIAIVMYSPSLSGSIEFTDEYAAYVIKQLLISGIAIIPTTAVGGTIGGALSSEYGS